jgi:hypothetical protein
VSLPKPLGIRFGRGNDGEAYVLQSDKNLGNTDDRIQVCSLASDHVPAISQYCLISSEDLKVFDTSDGVQLEDCCSHQLEDVCDI